MTQPDDDRMAILRGEIAKIADATVRDLLSHLSAVIMHANDIATGGEAFPVGVREIAARLVRTLTADHATITALKDRQ